MTLEGKGWVPGVVLSTPVAPTSATTLVLVSVVHTQALFKYMRTKACRNLAACTRFKARAEKKSKNELSTAP